MQPLASYITNYSLMERLTNETLNEMTDLDTVNVVLQGQANNIRTKIGDNFDGETIVIYILDKDNTYNMTYTVKTCFNLACMQ